MIEAIARAFLRWIGAVKPTQSVQEKRAHHFIVVGAWPVSNLVMCSWPERVSAFTAASEYAMSYHGVEFVVYERCGSVCAMTRPDDADDGERITDDDELDQIN